MNQTEHAETTVYLSLDASTMVASKQVHIEDIASVFCSQPDIMHDVKKIKLFTFRDNEQGLAFFGTAYSIMSYNGDVGAIDLLQDLYQMFTGTQASATTAGYRFGILFYCVGLFFGMLLFFNHGLNHKKADDPTPLQVQMRLYERDVNDAIVVDSAREGTSLDVD